MFSCPVLSQHSIRNAMFGSVELSSNLTEEFYGDMKKALHFFDFFRRHNSYGDNSDCLQK